MHVNCLQCSWSCSVRFFLPLFSVLLFGMRMWMCIWVCVCVFGKQPRSVEIKQYHSQPEEIAFCESDCSSVILIWSESKTHARIYIFANTLSQMVTFLFYLNVCHFSHCALFCVLFLRLFTSLYSALHHTLYLSFARLLLFICIIHRQNTEQFVM